MDFRIALGVEYEGTNYFGFQKQKSTKQTIQGSLEESISRVADHKVKTFCSGRTDAGVHAFMKYYILIQKPLDRLLNGLEV